MILCQRTEKTNCLENLYVTVVNYGATSRSAETSNGMNIFRKTCNTNLMLFFYDFLTPSKKRL